MPLTRTDGQCAQPPRKLPERDRFRACQLNQSRRERVTTEGVLINRGTARARGKDDCRSTATNHVEMSDSADSRLTEGEAFECEVLDDLRR